MQLLPCINLVDFCMIITFCLLVKQLNYHTDLEGKRIQTSSRILADHVGPSYEGIKSQGLEGLREGVASIGPQTRDLLVQESFVDKH